jgi:hypothetical protein
METIHLIFIERFQNHRPPHRTLTYAMHIIERSKISILFEIGKRCISVCNNDIDYYPGDGTFVENNFRA